MWMADLQQAVQTRVEEIARIDDMAQDLRTLLDAIPPGQIKQLYKDETCAGILAKYGVEE